MSDNQEKELTEQNTKFCEEFVKNGKQAYSYKLAYPDVKDDNVAGACASKLLRKANIKTYIEELQKDLAITSGISRLRVLREYESIAFSSIAHMHETWTVRKEFDKLTDEQKACISEIKTRTSLVIGSDEIAREVEEIHIKLYDKQKALESISKMLGYNEPDKTEITEHKITIIEPEFNAD